MPTRSGSRSADGPKQSGMLGEHHSEATDE
jgi:hypothetical protein